VYTVVTPHAGGAPVYEVTYWNGLTWRPCTLLSPPNFSTTGAKTLQIVLPEDWAYAIPAGLSVPPGMDAQRYWLRVRATTAPSSTAAVATVQVHQHTFPLHLDEQALLTMFAYPEELTVVDIAPALDLALPDWRTQRGTPRMYGQADTIQRAVRVVPLPMSQGAENGILGLGPGVGAAVTNNLVLCAETTPAPDEVPPWLEGLLMLHLASREAERLGESHAAELAGALRQVATGVQALVVDAMQQEFR
jgi:hypothetical protein